MRKITLKLDVDPMVMAEIRRISLEDRKDISVVLTEALIKGLAHRSVHGPAPKELFMLQSSNG